MSKFTLPKRGDPIPLTNPQIIEVDPKKLRDDRVKADEYYRLFMELLDAEDGYNKEWKVKERGAPDRIGILSTAETAHKIFFLVSDNGLIIGMCTIKHSLYDGDWFVSPIVIDRRIRGKGMGRFLLDGVLKQYPKGNTLLRVHANNPAGLALYRSLGFREMSFTMIRDPKRK